MGWKTNTHGINMKYLQFNSQLCANPFSTKRPVSYCDGETASSRKGRSGSPCTADHSCCARSRKHIDICSADTDLTRWKANTPKITSFYIYYMKDFLVGHSTGPAHFARASMGDTV